MEDQRAPTLQAVLVLHANAMRVRTGLSSEAWAVRVDERYCATVAPEHRSLPAPDLAVVTGAEDYTKLLRAWDQQLRRYTDGSLRFPVELLEAWVGALDDPWRTACNHEIAWRRGMYGAPRQPATPEGDHRCWGQVMLDFGELTQRMGRILADGSINAGDSEHLRDLIRQLRAMQADLVSLEHQAKLVQDASPKPMTVVK